MKENYWMESRRALLVIRYITRSLACIVRALDLLLFRIFVIAATYSQAPFTFRETEYENIVIKKENLAALCTICRLQRHPL
jgi:hypothetical protein